MRPSPATDASGQSPRPAPANPSPSGPLASAPAATGQTPPAVSAAPATPRGRPTPAVGDRSARHPIDADARRRPRRRRMARPHADHRARAERRHALRPHRRGRLRVRDAARRRRRALGRHHGVVPAGARARARASGAGCVQARREDRRDARRVAPVRRRRPHRRPHRGDDAAADLRSRAGHARGAARAAGPPPVGDDQRPSSPARACASPRRSRKALKDTMKTATLALENGQTFEGVSIGADGETTGEVVFNTSLTGYQEVLTDPSYSGQIVTMTAPQIGNYGVTDEDCESRGTSVAGFVVREASPMSSNWRAEDTFTNYLKANGIVAIAEIDTRALTRVLRGVGVMRGVIATGDVSPQALVERARASAKMEGADWVKAVTCEAPFEWTAASAPQGAGAPAGPVRLHRAAVARVGHAAHHRRLRPRDEVEHPAPLHQPRPQRPRVSGDDAGRRGARDQAGGDLLQQRSRRSGRARLRRPQRQGRRRVRRAGLRHLPRPPGAGDGHGRHDLQAEVRPPRHQPPGQAPRDREGRDHVAEPRLRRRPPSRCRTTSRSRT